MSKVTPKQEARWRANEALPWVVKQLNKAIAEQLKILLETKHLYQSVRIESEKILTGIREQVIPAFYSDFDNGLQQIPAQFTLSSANQFIVERTGDKILVLLLIPVN